MLSLVLQGLRRGLGLGAGLFGSRSRVSKAALWFWNFRRPDCGFGAFRMLWARVQARRGLGFKLGHWGT